MASTFAERLAIVRGIAGMSCRGLGLAVGLTESHVGQIERGDIDPLRIETDTVTKLADGLGVSVDWLLRGRGEDPVPAAVLEAIGKLRTK